MAKKDRTNPPPRGRDPKRSSLKAVRLSDVKPAKVSYLVDPYLPRGSLSLLEGDPGSGKSYVAAAIGAAITCGRTPDLVPTRARRFKTGRDVLYLTTEDSQETLRARFEAHHADLDRVFCVSEATSLRDPEPLAALFREHKPGLVVIDPIQALLAGTNMNAANSVRVALAPLIALATKYKTSVLAIRHLAKGGRGRAIYRGLGSIDFSAVARSILRIGEDPARPGSRLLAQVKNSYGPLGPSVEFEIGERLEWLGRSELTALDLDAKPSPDRGRSSQELAEDLVRDQLEHGPKSATEIKKIATAAGITEGTLRRAEKSLGVVHLRVNLGSKRGQGQWVWSLSHADLAHLEQAAPDDS